MSDAQDALPNPNPEGSELEPHQSVHIDPDDLARHYERDDVDVASLVRFGVAILAGMAIVGGVIYLMMSAWTVEPLPLRILMPPTEATPPTVQGPGLDAVPEIRLVETLQREDERLTTYGWADEAAGAARIPIDEAMRLMVERGIAAREADAPDFRLHPSFRLDSSGGLEPAGNNRFGEVEVEGTGQESSGEGGSVEDEGGDSPTEGSTETGETEMGGETEDGVGSDIPSGEGDQADEEGAPGSIDAGEEDATGEEPGGAQSGGEAGGSEGTSGNEGETGDGPGGDGPSGEGDQDDDEGAPGTIDPGEEDAEGEEPGGARSGS